MMKYLLFFIALITAAPQLSACIAAESFDEITFKKKDKKDKEEKKKKDDKKSKKNKAGKHDYIKPEDVAHFKKVMADAQSGIKNKIAEIVEKGLGNEDAYVFEICHKAILEMNDEKVYSALASQLKKMKKSENYAGISGGLDLLRYSNNPKNWEVSIGFIKSPNRGVGILALELAGQGTRKAVPEIMKIIADLNSKHLTTACAVLNYLLGLDEALKAQYFLNAWIELKVKFDKKPKPRVNGVVEFHHTVRLSSSTYYGIKMEVANTFFCIDTSRSMKPDDPVERPKKKAKPKKKKDYAKVEGAKKIEVHAYPELPEGNGSKIWTARRQLCQAIKSLNTKMQYGLIAFNGNLDAWREAQLIPTKNKKDLISGYEWVLYDTPLAGGTWMMQSVEIALRNPDTEVIFLLTDGAPIASGKGDGGSLKVADDDEIRDSKYFNDQYIHHLCYRHFHTRRIKINTVLIGKGERGENLLSAMAKITGGTYKYEPTTKKKPKKDKGDKKNKKDKKSKKEKESEKKEG